MRFALQAHAEGDNWAADVAIAVLSGHDRDCILNRRSIFLGVKAYDQDLTHMEFVDSSVEWYDWDFKPDDPLQNKGVVADYAGPICGDAVSVEFAMMVISEDAVHWRCWTKHGDIRLYTNSIPWDLLEGKK